MGSFTAYDLAHGGFLPDRKAQLRLHLTGNHYPPLPESFVEPCEKAIDYALAHEWTHRIELPDGITFRGEPEIGVYDLVQNCHLEAWIVDFDHDPPFTSELMTDH